MCKYNKFNDAVVLITKYCVALNNTSDNEFIWYNYYCKMLIREKKKLLFYILKNIYYYRVAYLNDQTGPLRSFNK